MAVTVTLRLPYHVFQLDRICDTSGIFLIKEGLFIVRVIGYGIIKDGGIRIVFRVAILRDLKVPCLCIFVGCIIGDIDLLPMGPAAVPLVQEPGTLIIRHGA